MQKRNFLTNIFGSFKKSQHLCTESLFQVFSGFFALIHSVGVFNIVLVQIRFLTKSSSTFKAGKAIGISCRDSSRSVALSFVIADTFLVMLDEVLDFTEGPGANGAMV